MIADDEVAAWRKCDDSECEVGADGLIDHWHLVLLRPDEPPEVVDDLPAAGA